MKQGRHSKPTPRVAERQNRSRALESVAFGLFGILFSGAFVASSLIHLDVPDDYAVGADKTYLEAPTFGHLVLFVILAVVVGIAAYVLFRALTNRRASRPIDLSRVPLGRVDAVAALLLVCWIPYLLVYWPGLIYGDTLDSLRQIFGISLLNNHHPLLYTLFIGACLQLGTMLGSFEIGLGIYSAVQMFLMAAVLAYLLCWVRVRSGMRRVWLVLMFAMFAFVPYFATYSVSLWKDPAFSCALVMVTLMLADLAFSDGACARSKKWLVGLALWSLLAIFTRNNGLYIIAACWVCVLVFLLVRRHRPESRRPLAGVACTIGVVVIASAVITGPVYKSLGLAGSSSDGTGILIAQMANVVVHDGVMTDEDRAYMESLMPLDEYANVYTPRIIDSIKDNEAFSKFSRSELLEHWASMLVRNPERYVEAWVLETYGFWTVNRPEVWAYTSNVVDGVPRNVFPEYADSLSAMGIYPENLLGGDTLRDVLVLECVQPPIGVLFWVMLFQALCLLFSGKRRWVIMLCPALALMLTLLVASPIWYWPRYALVLQLLIPLTLMLFATMGRARM